MALDDGLPWPESLRGIGSPTLLPPAFFERHTAEVAPDLLGKIVLSRVDGVICGGRIVETEAYLGSHDEGSHASTKGITERNAVMYGPPGRAYVYFTYGNHHMLNVVCELDGTAGAVLLRAFEPLVGSAAMAGRRGRGAAHGLANGPGRLAQALGIDLADNGTLLGEGRLGVFEASGGCHPRVLSSGRVGLARGHEAELRFYLEGNEHVSRAKTGPRRSTRARTGRT